MKESMFDVLMYLFENYMEEDTEFNPDQESLTTELSQAGFPRVEISKAFSWLEGLSGLLAGRGVGNIVTRLFRKRNEKA